MQPTIKRTRTFNANNDTILRGLDGSTEQGSVFREPSKVLEPITPFTSVLTEAGIGPIVAWGDIAMMYHGIPTFYVTCHVLIPDNRVEGARQALLERGYVDEPVFKLCRWSDFGAPCYELRHPQLPKNAPTFLLLGLSAVQPAFDNLDTTSYEKIGEIAFPPLLTLALSFSYALCRTKSEMRSIFLRTLLGSWCTFTKTFGYEPLGSDAMKGQPLNEKMLLFWTKGEPY